jgi:uncharacterized membrane protein YcaP (DUF421 family)
VPDFLALGGDHPDPLQAALRAVVVYAVLLAVVRLGERRVLGKRTPLDIVVAVMIGSLASRGIVGSTLWPSLVGAAALMGVHWILSALSLRSDRLAGWLEGRPRVLVRDGRVDTDALRRSHISRAELVAALREVAHGEAVEDVQIAVLELNGRISVLARRSGTRVLDVDVADGVQTVRIEVEGC